MDIKLRMAGLALAVGSAVVPGTAVAQYTAVPFVITPNQDPQVSATLIGVTVRADLGFPSDGLGSYTPISGMVTLNYGRFSVSAGAGTLTDSELPNELTLGASVGYDFTYTKAAMPTITIQAGGGYTSISAEPESLGRWDFPVALGFSLSFGPPDPALNAEPWLAPRVHVRSLDTGAAGSETDVGFGVSAGLKIITVAEQSSYNFGIHGAVDWLWIEEPGGDGLENEFTASVGLLVRWNTIRL